MPETTDKFHRIPIARKVSGNPIRTITISKSIKALYDTKRKIIVTYLFDVKEYTMKQAKEWVKKHKSNAYHTQMMENLVLADRLSELSSEIVNEIREAVIKIQQ